MSATTKNKDTLVGTTANLAQAYCQWLSSACCPCLRIRITVRTCQIWCRSFLSSILWTVNQPVHPIAHLGHDGNGYTPDRESIDMRLVLIPENIHALS